MCAAPWGKSALLKGNSGKMFGNLFSFSYICALLLSVSISVPVMSSTPKTLRVATFNVSMEATNYRGQGQGALNLSVLKRELASGHNSQIKNIAEIIQRARPDIVLLNEFDYIPDPQQGVEMFQKHYLSVAQHPQTQAIRYPYVYTAPVNTGEPSPFDLSGDGKATGVGADAWGFGHYPGQYGMLLLSRYPIDTRRVRSFRLFKWSDMPGALKPIDPETDQPFYSEDAWAQLRLSSKSLWDVPIDLGGHWLHVLASHPTPPVFDGPEDRNGRRNHDEIRLLADYLSRADYLYDDSGDRQPFAGQRFVIVGDLNASVYSSETVPGALQQLLNHSSVDSRFIPTSEGGVENAPGIQHAGEHTAAWKSRADYVLPSQAGWSVVGGAVFWPSQNDTQSRLVANRQASSDHRLVYLDLALVPLAGEP